MPITWGIGLALHVVVTMLSSWRRWLCAAVFALTLLPAGLAGQAAAADPATSGLPTFDSSPDGRFGGIQVSDVGTGVAKDLGLGWTREQFLFNAMPSYDPSKLASISTDQHLGPGLREVGLINFFAPYCNGGQDKRVPCTADAWGQFAGGLAKARQGKVNDWVLYNEQDICSPDMAGFSWNSANRAQDYFSYLKTGYQAIKGANPGANVIYGSLGVVNSACQTDNSEMTFWNQWLAAASADPATPANNWWFDNLALNIHKEPEKIYDLLRRYHESMQAHGFDKSTWIMEMGIPVRNDPIDPASNGDLAVDKDNQESFLIQAYANAIAGGADHVGIYTMRDFPPSDPAYQTIKTAIKYMSHVTSAVKTPDNRQKYVDRQDGVVTVTMKGPGFQTVVAYNRSLTPQTVTIPATAPVALVADKHGNEHPVPAVNGSYTLTLDPVTAWYDAPWGERVRFIGGSPLMLRQSA
ncbi:MAG: hypothetical protein JOZ39_05290 [Chloroflexi bacterium]|nr:hypothetical protein [Chloroflexota bacterium]